MFENKNVKDTLASFSVEPEKGLSAEEVELRQKRDGCNKLHEKRGDPWYKIFWDNIADPMTLVLAIAAIISLLPDVLLAFGIQSENNILESISIAAMGGVIASAVARYTSDAVKKLYEILGMRMIHETEREDG